MEVETLHVLPENIKHGELETLIIATIQTLECSYKNMEDMKFSSWLIIHLRKKFQGRILKTIYTSQ